MTEAAHSLYAEIDELAAAVDSLSPRGKAVIFGVCGRALAPLLGQVEQRSEGRFTVPDLDVALDLIQAFADLPHFWQALLDQGNRQRSSHGSGAGLPARADREGVERRLGGLVRIPRAGQ